MSVCSPPRSFDREMLVMLQLVQSALALLRKAGCSLPRSLDEDTLVMSQLLQSAEES